MTRLQQWKRLREQLLKGEKIKGMESIIRLLDEEINRLQEGKTVEGPHDYDRFIKEAKNDPAHNLRPF